MEHLIIKKTNTKIISNLIRIGDLDYFEGALLALFEDATNGHFYLFDWVDRNESSNRWIVYRVSPQAILDFINNKISHRNLFEKILDERYFFVDVKANHKISDYYLSELEEVPLKYYPNMDDNFDRDDSPDFLKIQAAIFKAISRKKQENEYSRSKISELSLIITDIHSSKTNRITKSQTVKYFENTIYSIDFPIETNIVSENHYDHINHRISKTNLNTHQLKRNKIYA